MHRNYKSNYARDFLRKYAPFLTAGYQESILSVLSDNREARFAPLARTATAPKSPLHLPPTAAIRRARRISYYRRSESLPSSCHGRQFRGDAVKAPGLPLAVDPRSLPSAVRSSLFVHSHHRRVPVPLASAVGGQERPGLGCTGKIFYLNFSKERINHVDI